MAILLNLVKTLSMNKVRELQAMPQRGIRREGERRGGGRGVREGGEGGRGEREGRDDCYTYSNGTTIFK